MRNWILIILVFVTSLAIGQVKDTTAIPPIPRIDTSANAVDDSVLMIRHWIYDTTGLIRIDFSNGDTMFVYQYQEFVVKDFTTEEQKKEFQKLRYNVKQVLPYAKLAAFRLQMMEDNLNMITSRKERDKYIKETEKAIKEEFMETLKSMSRSQGILLIKLIHRETGKSTYDILKGYRGSAETFYWSMFAKLYNADLKTVYDPILDYQIEFIIEHYNLE